MNHVLITGATGALGSALIPLFLRDPQTQVTLLLRADSPAALAARLADLLNYLDLDPDQLASSRVRAVRGDISREHLGLGSTELEELATRVTHLVHAAGNVKLNQPLDEARRTAVQSARSIVDFSHRCRAAGPFRKLEFISTVGVAGRRSGLITEERLAEPRPESSFHNTYEAAKWEAEQLMWREIDHGLPATVHRPSMIVGDSRDGKIIRHQVFYYLAEFLIGRQTQGLVPQTEGITLDIIPVDYVAGAIHLAAAGGLGRGEVWHLCSGPAHAWTLERLTETLRDMLVRRGESPPALTRVPLSEFKAELTKLAETAPGGLRKFLQGLPYLLEYLEDHQSFDNRHTDAKLSQHGLDIPPVERYLDTVMSAFWDRTAAR